MNIEKRLTKIGFEVIKNRVRLAKESSNRMKEQHPHMCSFFSIVSLILSGGNTVAIILVINH